MSARSPLVSAVIMACLSISCAAQPLSASWSQNPVLIGQPTAITLESPESITLGSGCGYSSVHMGTPAGPVVDMPFICPAFIIPVGPGNPYTMNWSQMGFNGQLPAGRYFVEFQWRRTNGQMGSSFYPITIIDPNLPTPAILTASGNGNIGTTISLNVSDPQSPGAPYVIGVSLTTNTGIGSPSGPLALDFDPLFLLAYPSPLPGIMTGFNGFLDANGNTVGAINLPSIPELQGLPLAIQSKVFDPTGGRITNALSRTMR